MTARKILAMIIAFVMVVSLCACSGEDDVTVQNEPVIQTEPVIPSKPVPDQSKFGQFIVISDGPIYTLEGLKLASQYIMYDPDNYVMYTYIIMGHSKTLSVMYNPDGTPKHYSPEGDETN